MSDLLFVSLSGRVIRDTEGVLYLNSHMNSNIISRYQNISDKLTLLLRDNCQTVDKVVAIKSYNIIPDGVTVIPCINPYKPITNVINLNVKRKIRETIEGSVIKADKVIIAQATGIYANLAIKFCKKYRKKYLVIVGGFSFECDWYNGIKGKIAAFYREYMCKKKIKNADFVLYVTNQALQSRYPTNGKGLGCSDVEICLLNEMLLEKRIEHYEKNRDSIIIGTMAQLDVKLKGLKYVIEAISYLKNKGYAKFQYQIVGNGSDKELKRLIRKYDVQDEVQILGSMPHENVYSWIDGIDIYIQPSFTEGLSRAILEAMSRACPVICSNVGGNIELGHKDFLFKPGNSEKIGDLLVKATKKGNLILLSKYSFAKANNYSEKELDRKRNAFLEEFMLS